MLSFAAVPLLALSLFASLGPQAASETESSVAANHASGERRKAIARREFTRGRGRRSGTCNVCNLCNARDAYDSFDTFGIRVSGLELPFILLPWLLVGVRRSGSVRVGPGGFGLVCFLAAGPVDWMGVTLAQSVTS